VKRKFSKILAVGLTLALLISMLVTAVPVAAADIVVSPITTIQAAIGLANPGDTIIVEAGTYNEDVTVDKNLILKGAQFGVDPRGSRAGDESEIVGVVVVTSAATDVVFDGFKFTSPTRAFTPRGFNLHIESESSTVQNNIFVAEENAGHTYSGYLDFGGITNATVNQNTFSGHLDLIQTPNVIGLGIAGAGIVTVADNEMHDVGGGGGIGIMSGNAGAVVNIDGNVIENTGNECIWVWNPVTSAFDTLSITSNDLSEATLNGIKFVAPVTGVVSVSGNDFWDNPVQVLDSAEVLDIQQVLDTNDFDRAVVVDNEGASLLHTIWSSIQDGIDAAQTDDTVKVLTGTYQENVVINESVTLISDTGDYRTTGVILNGPVALNNVENVTIQGLKFQDYSSSGYKHVIATDGTADNITIHANSFENCEGPSIHIYYLDTSFENWTITGNKITNVIGTEASGIWVQDLRNSTISNNEISNTTYAGMILDKIENVTVSNNKISNTPRKGIQVASSPDSNVVIEKNYITNTNTSHDADEGAITIYPDVTNIRIVNNTLTANYQGFTVRDKTGAVAPDVHVNFNNIYGNDGFGVGNFAQGGGRLDATNNYWGSINGPTHADNTFNVGHQGDAVSDCVDYVPWLDGPYSEGESFAPIALDTPEGLFSSIQAAINAATGTTITCVAGTYTEDVNITISLQLLGAKAGVPAGPDASPANRSNPLEESIIDGRITITGIAVSIIDGFTILSGGQHGIDLDGGEDVIKNNIIDGVSITVGKSGIFSGGGGGYLIANNNIRNYGQFGITFDGGLTDPQCTISGNYITNITGVNTAGIQTMGSWSNGHIFSNNVIENCGAGIVLSQGGHQVSGNTILNNSGSGILLWGKARTYGIQITQNTIEGNVAGIKLWPDHAGAVNNVAHFNNIVGNANSVVNEHSAEFDALYNYWGDETGPEHATLNTGAQGNAVSDNVLFSPWLYKTQEEFISGAPCYAGSVVLDNEATLVEETSYAGGWNTFSTPILLASSAGFLSDLLALVEGSDLSIVRAQRYDPVDGWVPLVMGGSLVGDDYQINSGEGFFIQVSTKGSLPILCGMELFWPQSRELSSGWNLVGAPSYRDKLVEDGLFSLGAATVVNSPGANPASWSYPPAATFKLLLPGRAYWVAMSADGTLMCFDGTPVADDLTWQLNQ